MTSDNKPQGLTATQKISLVAGTLPALYLLPSDANAAVVFFDNTNSFFASYNGPTSVEWDVDGDGNNDFLLDATTTLNGFSYFDDTPVTTPEHSSPLALLAMGVAGVYLWRKKRKSAHLEEDKAA